MNEKLQRLLKAVEKYSAINYAQSIISWDGLTGAPDSGADTRSKSVGALSALSHHLLINDTMKEDIDLLIKNKDTIDETSNAIINKIKQIYDKIGNITIDEYQAYTALTTKSQIIWEDCKRNNDFAKFKPYLEEIINYLLKFADYRGYEGHPYNLYINDYEEGMNVEGLNELFDKI